MISVWQSGFLPGSSTITQLTEIYDQFCKAMSAGKEIRVVFLDISKAFDRVWHQGLLHKLKKCGISGKLLDWLKDYLSDRQQRVIINGEHSTWGSIKAGVPQGSVLGPLLFLIFINDLTHVIRHCKIRLFADDTCLFIEVDDPNDTAELVDEDLEAINDWANKWHVSFSPPKTEEMIVSNRRSRTVHPPLTLNGQQIKQVLHHKHLGLTLSHDLTWSEHISQVVEKATRRLGIMRTLKYKLDRLSLERIYMAFVRPILEYGDIVWDSTLQALDPLEAIQRNAARIVTGASARCSTKGLYDETAWEPLSNRRLFHRLSLFYNIVNDKAPSYLIEQLPGHVQDRTDYPLRNRENRDVPHARLNRYANSFFPAATRAWNSVSPDLKNAPSLNAMKARHRQKLQKPNPLYYFGSRLESCIHARMRIKNSPLKAHLHSELNVIESPLCPCGSGAEEDVEHYFFSCQLYNDERAELQTNLLPYVINNPDYLLFGVPNEDHATNLHVFTAVHQFIKDTKRFY
jgi:hypothetical protein